MKELVVFVLLFILEFAVVESHPTPGREESDLIKKRSKRALTGHDGAVLWNLHEENGKYILPYVLKIESNPTAHNITEVMATAIAEYDRHSCIRFRPRTTEEPFITIRVFNSAYDMCGWAIPGYSDRNDWVNINVNCGNTHHTMLHELFHKLMFNHEHSRPDRDDYVRNRGLPYFSSINAFEEYTLTSGFDIFSISNYKQILKHPYDKLWARPNRLSHDDIKAINAFYSCPDTLQGRGCYKSALPTVVGNGSFYPIHEIYEPMQAVRLICADGYVHEQRPRDIGLETYSEYNGVAYSYCENGHFTPRTLTCKKVECTDDIKNCGKLRKEFLTLSYDVDFCDASMDVYGKPLCSSECGLCGDGVNFCTQYPTIYGYGHIPDKDYDGVIPYFVQGESVHIICDEGFTSVGPIIATCTNGTFDVDKFYCVAANPPNGEEVCSRVDDSSTLLSKKCSSLRLEVSRGRFVPDQACYNNRDFVQLKCDNGFHPESSDLAQCQNGKWKHTFLKCVPFSSNDCMDTSMECEEHKLQGLCESADMIGFMRNNCRLTCGWCGKCQGSPIFDRMKSELSPIKFSYECGENITLQCFPDWKPMAGKSSSKCQNGRFHPPHLECEPIEGVCVYTPDLFGSAHKSLTPNMLHYPSGRTVNIRCSNKQYNSSQHYDQVICENGHFVPENFNCPDDDGRTTCDLQSLVEDSVDIQVDLVQFNSHLKETYADGEEVNINCDDDGANMTATCHAGVFTYINTCAYKAIKKSCYGEDLPRLYGNGVIEPVKDVYLHKEFIYLNCADGSSSVSQKEKIRCVDGSFFADFRKVSSLICSEDGCGDSASDCQPERCHEEDVRGRCRRTCGVCEGVGCSTSSVGWQVHEGYPYKEIYRNGEMISMTCHKHDYDNLAPQVVNATCLNGQFDKPLPLCPAYEDNIYENLPNWDFIRHGCSYFEDCDNILTRYLCAKTCHERLAAKELTEGS